MNLAIISGTSINRSGVFRDWDSEEIGTPFGAIELKRQHGITVVNRHGFSNPLPPHRTNYRGYVSALQSLRIDAVVAITSVGSLREELPPGTLVSCDDYVSFAPMTFNDDHPSGFAPIVDNRLLEGIARRAPFPIVTHKVYAQTRGPRFETRAEVRILQSLGCDVVGMTFANEADLLLESGISVTSLCMIDNFAHGIGEQKLSMGSFREAVQENQKKIDEILEVLVSEYGN